MEEGPENSRSKDSETSSHLKCVRDEEAKEEEAGKILTEGIRKRSGGSAF